MINWLSGVTVVDLTANVAGPFCTLVLKDLGARVIKLEGPDGDAVRGWPPFAGEHSTTFSSLNRGKESIAIDLKDPRGAAVAKRLLSQCDVFVESLRPGAVDRLGLGWPELSSVNSRLIYLSLSAFGDVGPMAGQPGFDAILQAYTGLMDVTGYPDGPPVWIGTGIVDFGTGLWAALSVVGGLLQRAHTDQGCRLESTLLGTALSFMMHHVASAGLAGVVPGRIGTAQHNSAPYEGVTAKDGMLMLGVANDGLWQRLLTVIDDGRLAKDDRFATNRGRVQHRDEIVRLIGELLAERQKEEVVAELSRNGIPASVIRRVDAVLDDPQVAALELIQPTSSGMSLPVAPIRCNGAVPNLSEDPPSLGESTARFLTECGFSHTEIVDLIRGQVVVGPHDDDPPG